MQRGFTLIELMVVIVILGGLVGIVGLNVIGQQRRADEDTARVQMANLATAVRIWTIRHRGLPSRLEQLIETDPGTGESLLEALPPDPWGTPYAYERMGGNRFRIVSYGYDREEGSEDDIMWPATVERAEP